MRTDSGSYPLGGWPQQESRKQSVHPPHTWHSVVSKSQQIQPAGQTSFKYRRKQDTMRWHHLCSTTQGIEEHTQPELFYETVWKDEPSAEFVCIWYDWIDENHGIHGGWKRYTCSDKHIIRLMKIKDQWTSCNSWNIKTEFITNLGSRSDEAL